HPVSVDGGFLRARTSLLRLEMAGQTTSLTGRKWGGQKPHRSYGAGSVSRFARNSPKEVRSILRAMFHDRLLKFIFEPNFCPAKGVFGKIALNSSSRFPI